MFAILTNLFKKLKPKFIFVSNNFRFGNKREGDVKLLISYEESYNYKVIKPKPILINKKIVSSSLIRNFLEKGFLNKANSHLPYGLLSSRIKIKSEQFQQINFSVCVLFVVRGTEGCA